MGDEDRAGRAMSGPRRALGALGAGLAGVMAFDLLQRRHAVLRNFPVVGHLRYLLETFGPELRQYIVTGNDEERPFSRDQRRWVYASAKRETSTFGFGSDNEMESGRRAARDQARAVPGIARRPDGEPGGYPDYATPVGKVLGGARGRRHAFRPASVVNVSGMSFGALSGPAVEAINRGCALAGCLQNTGEGGIAPHHRHGGELVFQIGTGTSAAATRTGASACHSCGRRSRTRRCGRSRSSSRRAPSRASAGCCPAAKVTPEIAAIRGVEAGQDCVSPPGHSAFRDADELLDFVERIAEATGLPVGIKSAVGEQAFWTELAERMAAGDRGVDFVTVDGGEGGTGAAPLAFADHVALPFKLGFSRVYATFAAAGLADDVVFVGAGKLGFPETALVRLRPRLRHGQRRARGDARDRLHPGPALPHRTLPGRRRDAVALARRAGSTRS